MRRYREAVAGGDPDAVPVWAGEDIDLIHEIEAAGAIGATLAADAESALALAKRLGAKSPDDRLLAHCAHPEADEKGSLSPSDQRLTGSATA